MAQSFLRCTILLPFCLLIHFIAQGQSLRPIAARVQQLRTAGEIFTPVQVFSAKARKNEPASELERKTQFLRLDQAKLRELMDQRPECITLELPWMGSTVKLLLYQAPILSDGFRVRTSGPEAFEFRPGVCYRGIIEHEPHSLAAVSCWEGEVMGVIAHPLWGNLNLGRLERPGNQLDYVLFNDADIPDKPSFECLSPQPEGAHLPKGAHIVERTNVTGCVQVYFECDYELFQNKTTVSATVGYVAGFFNAVSTIYNNESISIIISQIFVWTTPDNYSTSSSSAALNDFVDYRTDFEGDLAHLVGLGGGGLGGIAYLDVLCTSSNYAFSNIHSSNQNYPTYSWTVNVVAHEMGHNVVSPHTHWCGWTGGAIDTCGPLAGYPPEGNCQPGPPPTNGGTIMSYCHLTNYGINFANGFGPQPGNALRDAVTAASCLAASCPSNSCTAPTALTTSGITSNTAIIGWNAPSGATTYDLQYRVSGTVNWTTVLGVGNPHTLTGLQGNTLYEVEVRSVCGSTVSPYRTGLIFKTITSPCTEPNTIIVNGITFTSAVLNWTQPGSATQWEIQYGLENFTLGNGTTLSVNMKPYTLNGLSSGTTYDFYVRALCGGGLGNSTWVGPNTFTTTLTNDLSSGAIELIVDAACPGAHVYSNVGSGTSSGEFSPSTSNGGYWNTGISNTVWFKFAAPPSGSVKITTDIDPLGSLDDTQLALYSTPNPTTLNDHLVSNEDGGTYGSTYATLAYYSGLTPGVAYYIQVDGWNTDVGSFCIEVHETFSLANPGASCKTYTQNLVNGSTAPDKWFNVYSKPSGGVLGLPILAVKSSANLGTVTAKEILNSSVQTATNGVKYMQRYYNISSSLNPTAARQIRLFFTDTELDNLKIATGQTSLSAEDLNVSKFNGSTLNCTPNNNANSNVSLITNVAATSIGNSGVFYLDFASADNSELGAHFGLAPLPVELLYFHGKIKPDRNTLEWATSDEQNVADFIAERSPDGQTNWKDIGSLRPQISSTPENRYTLDDPLPLPYSYYRLKIKDLDGTEHYSNVLALQRALPDGLLSIHPNPTEEMLFAEYQTSEEATATFRVLGADGRLILEQIVELAKGLNILPFEVRNLPPGLYFFAVRGRAGLPFVKK